MFGCGCVLFDFSHIDQLYGLVRAHRLLFDLLKCPLCNVGRTAKWPHYVYLFLIPRANSKRPCMLAHNQHFLQEPPRLDRH